MQILRIDSSTTGDQSISRKLTDELLAISPPSIPMPKW